MVELRDRVAELLTFRGEVARVLGGRLDLERHLLDDRQPVAVEPRELARIVREDADRRQPEVGEDLVADPPLPRVGREPEREVRLDRVEPVRLQLVGAELVEEADSAALLAHVQDDAAILLGLDARERVLELLAAVAEERVEDVARQALGVHADEDVLRALDVALHERDVLLVREELAVRDRLELAELGRQPHRDDALDELLHAPAVLDEVGDGDHLQVVALAERREIRDAGHRPVVVHDLADDAGGIEAREPREVDGRLGLARALSTPPGFARSGKTWPGCTRSCGDRAGIDRDLDRARAIVGRDTRRDSLARLDRDGERRAERRLVVVRHRPELELVAALGRQAEADQAASVRRHERDRLGRDELRRDREVALVLAIRVVDDDDERDRSGCPRSPPRSSRRAMPSPAVSGRLPRPDRSPHRETSRSTYFARTSASRFTAWPGSSADERRGRERVRDERDRERVVGELGDGERHAVDGDRPLLDAVAQDVVGRLDEDAQSFALGLDRLDATDRVDVTLDVVPAELLACTQRRLDVDALTGPRAPSVVRAIVSGNGVERDSRRHRSPSP